MELTIDLVINHYAGVGRIAGLLSLEVDDQNASMDALQRVGSELAMHVVAAKPLFLTKEDVSSEAMENEREILKSQVPSCVIKSFTFDNLMNAL